MNLLKSPSCQKPTEYQTNCFTVLGFIGGLKWLKSPGPVWPRILSHVEYNRAPSSRLHFYTITLPDSTTSRPWLHKLFFFFFVGGGGKLFRVDSSVCGRQQIAQMVTSKKEQMTQKKLSAYLWFLVVGKSYNRLHSLCLQQVGKFPVNISKTTDIHLVFVLSHWFHSRE